MFKSIRRVLLSLLLLPALGSGYSAASIIHDVELGLAQSSGNGFAYSYLHSAGGTGTGAATNGSTVALGGLSAGNFINKIVGDYDTSSKIFSLNQNMVALKHNQLTLSNGNMVVADSLTLTGGKLIFNNNWAGGFIDYSVMIKVGTANPVVDTGSFYFASKRETGNASSPLGSTPNSGVWGNDSISFAEWGNNWTYSGGGADWSFLHDLDSNRFGEGFHDHTDASGNRLGLDLHGTGQAILAVPEPVSLALWGGFFVLSMVTCGRRRA